LIDRGSGRPAFVIAGEGVAIAKSQALATVATALVAATVCVAVLLTAGLAAANEARVLATIDTADTTTVVLSDPTGEGRLYADTIPILKAISTVEDVVGLGKATDVRNVYLGDAAEAVAARTYWGDLPSDVVTVGRLPVAGEAMAGSAAVTTLRAAAPATYVRGRSLEAAVVGAFEATGSLAFLNDSVLVAAPLRVEESSVPTMHQVLLRVTTVADVDPLVSHLRGLVHADNAGRLVIESPAALLELRSVLSSQLSADARRFMVAVLAIGLTIVVVTQLAAVAQRRRDFGRRRALGASRSTIVVLVVVQTAVGSGLGVIVGAVVGSTLALRMGGQVPPPLFVLAVSVLAFLASIIASLPPATLAARTDPVRILRVA